MGAIENADVLPVDPDNSGLNVNDSESDIEEFKILLALSRISAASSSRKDLKTFLQMP